MNNIELSTIYLPMLDEKYKAEWKSADSSNPGSNGTSGRKIRKER